MNNPLLEEALILSESPRVTRRKRGSFSEFDTNGDMMVPSSPFGRRRSRNPPDVGNQRDTNELFKVISQDESRERNPSLGNLGEWKTNTFFWALIVFNVAITVLLDY